MKIKANTSMVYLHFLRKYIFIDFFHFLTKQLKNSFLNLRAVQCYDGLPPYEAVTGAVGKFP